MSNLKGWVFVFQNWKLIVHLLFKTRRFGVNNQFTVGFDSILGRWTWRERLSLMCLVNNYKFVKMRANVLGFLSPETCHNLGWKNEVYRAIHGRW